MSYSFIELLSIAREIRDDYNIDTREVLANMVETFDDFEVDGYRFIASNAIDDILCEELEGDEYILGCFNAWFLADVLDIDQEAIEAMQQAEAFEALGKLIISLGKVRELAKAYSSADTYGHHFAHYDGAERELSSADYYVFKV
jgi:hypothetical protein